MIYHLFEKQVTIGSNFSIYRKLLSKVGYDSEVETKSYIYFGSFYTMPFVY